ncbi:hypothetical protein MHYP_G00321840 [Metynnis hypsauchen]
MRTPFLQKHTPSTQTHTQCKTTQWGGDPLLRPPHPPSARSLDAQRTQNRAYKGTERWENICCGTLSEQVEQNQMPAQDGRSATADSLLVLANANTIALTRPLRYAAFFVFCVRARERREEEEAARGHATADLRSQALPHAPGFWGRRSLNRRVVRRNST